MARFNIAVLPGDGIGPEVMAQAIEVLRAVEQRFEHRFELTEDLVGGAAIDAHSTALRPQTLEMARRSDAVLFGAVGGPKWDDPAAKVRPEQGLLAIRKGLGLFANLRPVKVTPLMRDASTLKPEVLDGVDIVVIRELTGGLYFGKRGRDGDTAYDTMVYSVPEIERIARAGFEAARAKVTSVDKANVLESSRLWREVVVRVHAEEFAHLELQHLLVDNAAMQLIANPSDFEVIVTENMFGDILSDEAAMLTGSIGLLPSASLGGEGPSLFEPVHGSAPDIAGRGVANPLAMFLSAAMLLRHGFAMEEEATAVESAVDRALADGLRTPDLGGSATTADAAQAVLNQL